MDRREYLKLSGLAAMTPLAAMSAERQDSEAPWQPAVNLAYDGHFPSPHEYVAALERAIRRQNAEPDFYGVGGAVSQLESTFAELSGKEAGLYLPSGTMANQLAIRVLAGNKSKVFVQDDSHVFRDEADAAQRIHNKRLVPLEPVGDRLSFDDLLNGIDNYRANEVFETGVGAISIENPVRRRLEQTIDIGELEKISAFGRDQGIGLHLDGARIFMAAQWTGIPVRRYCDLFDTVYFSLYKYLGARAGAVLTGPAEILDEVRFWMKPFGGVEFQSWPDAAVALDNLDGFEERLGDVRTRSDGLLSALDSLSGLRVERVRHGCHAAKLYVEGVAAERFTEALYDRHSILIRDPRPDGFIMLKANETILGTDEASLTAAFEDALTG